jgi:hypothetical protein
MVTSHVVWKGKDKVALNSSRVSRTRKGICQVEPSQDVTKSKVWIVGRVCCRVLHVIPVILSVEPVNETHRVAENWVVGTIPNLLWSIASKIKEHDRIAGRVGKGRVKDQGICETGYEN